MHPFAFRVHTHRHGTNVAGWIVRENPFTGEDSWFKVGQRDPQLPQLFEPVANKTLVVEQGDMITARCEMKNDEDR